MLDNSLFYIRMNCTYPSFKNGLYLEEYFLNKMLKYFIPLRRKYIPSLWTNIQVEHCFNDKKEELQQSLDRWVQKNTSANGYFTIVQHDDGVLLNLPENTIVFGACSGNIPIPLIYEDKTNRLETEPKKTFNKKPILCSFVGNVTSNNVLPNVRREIFNHLLHNQNFRIIDSACYNNSQKMFIETTIHSKFCLSPRGYGRSSFRFFESFLLGTIPVYVWNDYNWLPFKDIIDYERLCIVIHISQINMLESILLSIDETKYKDMFSYYHQIKHLFTLEGMSNEIIRRVNLA